MEWFAISRPQPRRRSDSANSSLSLTAYGHVGELPRRNRSLGADNALVDVARTAYDVQSAGGSSMRGSPRTLPSPPKVAQDGRWIKMRLQGMEGQAVVEGLSPRSSTSSAALSLDRVP